MRVRVPTSLGRERKGRPSYTLTECSELSDQKRDEALKNIGRPENDVCLEFTGDEARRIYKEGWFNTTNIGSFANDLDGVTTTTFMHPNEGIMIRFLARFSNDERYTPPDNLPVGAILPRQLPRILNEVIMIGPS